MRFGRNLLVAEGRLVLGPCKKILHLLINGIRITDYEKMLVRSSVIGQISEYEIAGAPGITYVWDFEPAAYRFSRISSKIAFSGEKLEGVRKEDIRPGNVLTTEVKIQNVVPSGVCVNQGTVFSITKIGKDGFERISGDVIDSPGEYIITFNAAISYDGYWKSDSTAGTMYGGSHSSMQPNGDLLQGILIFVEKKDDYEDGDSGSEELYVKSQKTVSRKYINERFGINVLVYDKNPSAYADLFGVYLEYPGLAASQAPRDLGITYGLETTVDFGFEISIGKGQKIIKED